MGKKLTYRIKTMRPHFFTEHVLGVALVSSISFQHYQKVAGSLKFRYYLVLLQMFVVKWRRGAGEGGEGWEYQ